MGRGGIDVLRVRLLLRFCEEALQPAEYALPAFAVSLGLFEISGKAFLRDSYPRACARLFGTARVQGIHGLRLKFPADDRFLLARVTADPGMDKLARRIDFKILAFHVKFRAVGA